MIKAIIFDADGMVLEQERPSIFLPRDYGISIENLNSFFHGPFQECLVGKTDLKEVIYPYLFKWGWSQGLDAFLNLWFTREVSVNKELVDYINELKSKGIKCLLATNQEKYRFQYFLDQLDFANIFDKVYASVNVGHKKTSLEFLSKIFKDLNNIKKEEILFWDDRPENVKFAKDFGINAELFTSVKDFKEKMLQYNP